MQLELSLPFEPTTREICMMCHFSSECDKCCKSCKERCNGGQKCMQGELDQSDRMDSWTEIVRNNEHFSHLKRFI